MTIDEQELRRLATGSDAPDGLPELYAPARPLAEIRARAAVLRRRGRVRWAAAGAACLGIAVGVTTSTVAGSTRAFPSPRPSGSPRRMPLIVVAPDTACAQLQDPPMRGYQLDQADRVSRIPARLLALPDARLAGTPDSVTGGAIKCFTGRSVIDWYGKPDGKAVSTFSTAAEPLLAVSGPDDPYPCSTAKGPGWPFGGQESTGTARGMRVTVYRRSSGEPRACAVWTGPGGHRWFAVSTTTDTAALLGWIGQLRLTSTGVDPASPVTGLTQLGNSVSYQPPGQPSFGPPRAFVESHGYTPDGSGYSLAALDRGDLIVPSGSGVTPVHVHGTAAWWIDATKTLLWRDSGGIWFVLRTESTQGAAIQLAESVRGVSAEDARWNAYLSSAYGYSGTPAPRPSKTVSATR
jgi:hypothetical protein